VIATYEHRDEILNTNISFISAENNIDYTIDVYSQASEKISPFTQKYIVGATFDEERITAYFNNQPYHGPPLALSMVHNAILKSYKGDDYGILVVNHPLPYQGVDKVRKLSNSI